MDLNNPTFIIAIVALIGAIIAIVVSYASARAKPGNANDDMKKVDGQGVAARDANYRVIVGPSSRPIIELFLAERTGGKGEDFYTKRIVQELQPVLACAPNLVTNAINATGTSVVIRFAPDVAKGLADGSFSLMNSVEGGFRANAVDASHKIVGQGSIEIVSNYNPMVVVAGAWQILAIITAQKYLADIDKRLLKLEGAVYDVKAWLELDRWTKVIGNLKFLQTIGNSIGNIAKADVPGVIQQLEAIEREMCHLGEAFKAELESASANFERMPVSGVGLNEKTLEIKRIISEYQRHSRSLLVATHLRGHAAELRVAFPTTNSLTLDRIKSVTEDFAYCRDNVKSFESSVLKKIPELKGRFSLDDTDKKKRDEVRGHLEASLRGLHKTIDDLQSSSEEFAAKLRVEDQKSELPVLLEVNFDKKGAITEVRKLGPEIKFKEKRPRSK